MADRAARNRNDEQPGFLRTALQSVGLFIGIQFVMRQVLPKVFTMPSDSLRQNNVTVTQTAGQVSIPPFSERPSFDEISEGAYSPVPQFVAPMWNESDPLDIIIYVSPSIILPSTNALPKDSLVLYEQGMVFTGDDTRDIHTSFPVPKEVQNNGTLFGHIFVALSGSPWNPSTPEYDQAKAFHFVRPLTQYLPKKKAVKTRNLITGSAEDEGQASNEDLAPKPKIKVPYYHPNFTLAIVPNTAVQSLGQMHPAVREWVQFESSGARDITGQNGWYYPTVFLNTFWQLRTHMTEINSTVTELPLNIHLTSMANWKFSIIAGLDFQMKQSLELASQGQTLPGGGDGSEFEELKRILLDSNPYLLATTVVVGVLHTVFEMLAFKNDVSHWRQKKDNVGVSVRTILANVFMQTIIFLYLIDNTENTSWMILFGQGVGILIEAWKITKTVNVRIRPTPADSTSFPWWLLPYTLTFEDKHQLSDTEKKTEEYDQIAFKYLYMVAVPLLVAYAVYSVMYVEHKSWYSFVITTLVGSVYAYGFLMMVPSLYINYRLKSVAHMPAKAMTYKFLNTFIDDLFAFTIKMPTLHRLATLRDDVIFFVYLYQSYKYKVDYTRVNEFGQGGDNETVADKLANQPDKSPAGGKSISVADAAKSDGSSKTTGTDQGSAKRRK